MHPAVVTAVLLLVGVLNTVTALNADPVRPFCEEHFPDRPCGDGWSRIDDLLMQRCAKYFQSPKTFTDAQEHCRTLNSSLVSLHNDGQMYRVLCLSMRADSELKPFWIGARRSGGQFKDMDESPLDYMPWHEGQPDNAGGDQDCVESNFKDWGWCNDVSCSEEKNFVCAKNV